MLILSNKQKLDILNQQKLIIDSKKLIEYLNNIKKITISHINKLLILPPISETNDYCVTPILWQFGHIIHFYLKNTLYLLCKKYNFKCNILNFYIKQFETTHNIDFNLYFDSYYTSRNYRFEKKLCFHRLKIIYISIIKILICFIKNKTKKNHKVINENTSLSPCSNYLIMLSILHNSMHNENYKFTNYYLLQQKIVTNHFTNYIICEDTPITNELIKISKGSFNQGSTINSIYLAFDNELPTFSIFINEFYVSKYCITEYEYIDFVKDNGYINDNNWSYNGLLWKKENNILHPLYWFNNNNIWFRKHFNQIIKIGSNLPMCNISYYEAEAYCKWKNVRLIQESEYEYLATNHGTTLYPWGNNPISNTLCNLNNSNNSHNYCVNVDSYTNGNNIDDVSQLIGNVWEWCENVIYPYNGFIIDPIYREMSYPYFGQKKICRGGCFCVDPYLIHSKYRNAQLPECRIQFIGFRVCKDI